ncbi:hypothetical protein TRVL_04938 [Trypanosoma vivax]|nr:hypothetical protein TRVL_04938 [Trypanosoma vivax]
MREVLESVRVSMERMEGLLRRSFAILYGETSEGLSPEGSRSPCVRRSTGRRTSSSATPLVSREVPHRKSGSHPRTSNEETEKNKRLPRISRTAREGSDDCQQISLEELRRRIRAELDAYCHACHADGRRWPITARR